MQELRDGALDGPGLRDPGRGARRRRRYETYWPPAEIGDLVGATFFPTDATVNPGDAALALAKGANDRGATFVFGVTRDRVRAARRE